MGSITRGYVARDLAKLSRAACVQAIRCNPTQVQEQPKSSTHY